MSYTYNQAKKVVDDLERMGFFSYSFCCDLEPAKKELCNALESGSFATNGLSEIEHKIISFDRRCYGADNEDLAEAGVAGLLETMKPILIREGVLIGSIEENFGEDKSIYEIIINNHIKFPIFNNQEESGSPDSWTIAFVRTIKLLNTLLTDASSSIRAYGVNGGNDGEIVLLTQEMHDYIAQLDLEPQNKFISPIPEYE
jgi:hypothetical protein